MPLDAVVTDQLLSHSCTFREGRRQLLLISHLLREC